MRPSRPCGRTSIPSGPGHPRPTTLHCCWRAWRSGPARSSSTTLQAGGEMPDSRAGMPASLQVYRYTSADGRVRAVIGEVERSLPRDELAAQAKEALSHDTFMCYAVSQADDFVGDEICFIPQGDHCEILSIRTNGWQRHHGDHRRSLVEILNNLAAAVACGKLRVLDDDEMDVERQAGEPLLEFAIADSASLASARDAVDDVLHETRLDDGTRRRTILCLSEAVTN